MLLHLLVWRCCFMAVLLGLLLCLLLPPLVAASTKRCPLGTRTGNCSDNAKCAIFDANSAMCVAWADYACSSGQYRNMRTCECIDCPRGSGSSCVADNECCALEECIADPAPASTPKPKPFALAPASKLSPLEADGFALILMFLLWFVCLEYR